jgi:hypothetical protein
LFQQLQTCGAAKRRKSMTSEKDPVKLFEELQAATPQLVRSATAPPCPNELQPDKIGPLFAELIPSTPPPSSQLLITRTIPEPVVELKPAPAVDLEPVRQYLARSFSTIIQSPNPELDKREKATRPRSHLIFPQGRLFHSVQALLVAIGWMTCAGPSSDPELRPADRGLVFVED